MSVIRVIVGLGNPGPTHQEDRHNAGFWMLDALAHAHSGPWRLENRFHGEVARVHIAHQDLWLLKPHTFMNRSGQAVGALTRFYRILPAEVLVVHDELDLEPGILRLKRGGGSGGHNGLKDISAALGSPDYARLRIGIGHPRKQAPGRDVADFVLQKPSRDEYTTITERFNDALEILPSLVAGHWERATQRLHAPIRRS
jgi:PTH1 family peptidyl-tRNA hydrolase